MQKKKYLRIFNLIFVFMCCLLIAMPAALASESDKIVRVGWYDGIFNSISNGRRYGYGYEYQQKLAAYTGWRYEYVSGTWPQLLEMLEQGEIDLLSDVTVTPERQDKIFFSSQAMGYEDYYIFIGEKNGKISSRDKSTLQGIKIGVNKGSYQAKLLYQWLEKNNIKAQVNELVINEFSYEKLLENGDLDAVVAIGAFDKYTNCIPLMKIGSSDVYWAVSRNRPDLLQELNEAMQEINSSNADYNRELHDKYMAITGTERFLPEEELKWLEKHGTIRIGYRADYLPFCALDEKTGELKGLLKDFIKLGSTSIKNYNIKLEAIAYPSTVEAVRALQRKEIDAVFPIGMSSYDAEINNLLITDCLAKTEIYAIIRNIDRNKFSLDRQMIVAENRSNISYSSMMSDAFPNWSSHGFNTTFECLQGTSAGKADCVLVSNYRIHVLSDMMRQFELTQASTGRNMYFSFAVNRDDTQLYSVLNRIIKTIPSSTIVSSLAKNSIKDNNVTLRKFVRDNMAFVFILLTGFVIIVVLLVRSTYLAKEATALNHNLAMQKEQLLKARERAEAANNAKTSFLFNMSHDIRTPMNAIIGFRRLLEKYQDDPQKRSDYLKKIDASSSVLLSIINNVLEMARIEKGTLELDESVWNAQQFHASVCDFFADSMKRKNITFSSSFKIEHKYIYCDATKLREIFMNILSNAYKYTNEGGKVDFMLEELPHEKEGWVYYQATIADTGIGMSEEFLPHIYEEFAREKNTTFSKVEGTGLGMPIVKRLVGFMNGKIEVRSKQGEGTTFVITIPYRLAEQSEVINHDGIEVDPKLFAGKRLLLVEDNDLNAEIAREILQEVGFLVEWAEDGEVCLKLLEEAQEGYYNLILMDIQMPNMNGYEATRAIRSMENANKANIPIVAMTANAFEEDRHEAFRAGMNGHVAKPINIGELMSEIANYIV